MAELNHIRSNLRNAAQEAGPGLSKLSLADWLNVARIAFPDATEEQVREALQMQRGGPALCPSPCGECSDAHHFSDAMIEDSLAYPDHEAAKAHVECWYACKHCPAWLEYDFTGEEDEEEDPQ